MSADTIGDVDERLRAWVLEILGEVPVTFGVPGADPGVDADGIAIHLLAVRSEVPRPARTEPPPLKIDLRYLLTSSDEDPMVAHTRLGELTFAAMVRDDLDVIESGPSVEDWLALGVPCRGALLLDVPLVRERTAERAPPVTHGIEIVSAPVATIGGVLVGQHDGVEAPLARARVEIPSLRRSVTTDDHGRFRIRGLPGDPPVRELVIHAKGRTRTVSLTDSPSEDGDHVIRISVLED